MRRSRTEKQEQDKPPSYSRNVQPWLVAVIANIKGETALPADGPMDAGAEYDKLETIQAIQQAIESEGHSTLFVAADADLPFALRNVRPDICFNLAEGQYGDSREAQVPAVLEMLGIPYTASRVLANAISLDKALTKRIWRDTGLPVAGFQLFNSPNEKLQPSLKFPLFVKPSREGTGMGIDLGAVVHNAGELKKRVAWVLDMYHQPALVEDYLPGREFTVGVLGRSGAQIIGRRPELFDASGFHHFPILEIESMRSITPGVYGYKAKSKELWEHDAPGYLCPAQIDAVLEKNLQQLAQRAHNAIGALDVSRVDIRLDAQGKPRLIEINTLPGINPEISDLCIMAHAEGLDYRDLILEILTLAATRYNLLDLPLQLMSKSISAEKYN